MFDPAFIGADGHDDIDHMAQLDGSIQWDGGPSHFQASRREWSDVDRAHYESCLADYLQTKAMCAGG